jgi:hypothetical protein
LEESTSYEALYYAFFSNFLSFSLSSAQIFSAASCFPLNARDQVSGPSKSTGKIIVFYILIFKFLDKACELLERISAKEFQGYYEFKHKAWFDEGCST